MRHALYLATRYLARNKLTTGVLAAAIAVVLALPLGLRTLVRRADSQLRSRAAATPLLLGAKGSPLELVLNSLYFRRSTPPRIEYRQSIGIAGSNLATAIPLYVRFRAGPDPIVGATLDYFTFRRLRVARGGLMTRLGDCVLGAEVAARRGLEPGGSVVSSPESAFSLAGVYPLKMRVTGILAPTGTPDDRAVFVDLKTAWLIEGLAHGHQDLASPEAAGAVLERRGNLVIGNASVVEYNEVTPENLASFHFHGDPDTFPVTAAIVVPRDRKAAALLLGRFQDAGGPLQLVRPENVMEELMATVFRVQGYVAGALAGVAAATLAATALVFVLSIRLRRRQLRTMARIGGARSRIAAALAAEAAIVLAAGVLLAVGIVAATARFGAGAMERLLTGGS